MSTQITFILYLVYGFVFILMGVIILQLKNRELSGVPLIRILYLLGIFGIVHGLSEWMTMAQISMLFYEYNGELLFIKEIFKIMSFYFLLNFSIMTLPDSNNNVDARLNIKKFIRYVPAILLFFWVIRVIFINATYGFEYLEFNRAGSTIIIRYLMSFPAGILSCIGLLLGGKKVRALYSGKLHIWYYGLGLTLLVYGIVDGLFVRNTGFFPANYINYQLFYRLTGIPIEIMKIMIGIFITYYVLQISMVFEKEKKSMIDKMVEAKSVETSRKKLNRDIHDRIIQRMFGASLKIEAYFGKSDIEFLKSANIDLQNGIKEARDIIGEGMLKTYHSSDIVTLINELINEKKEEAPYEIIFEDLTPILSHGIIAKEKATQIYYILQEAVTNATKHSNATRVLIRLKEEYEDLIVEMEDNGQGFKTNNQLDIEKCKFADAKNKKNLGIDIMKNRAEEIGGEITITSSSRGVRVRLLVKMGGE